MFVVFVICLQFDIKKVVEEGEGEEETAKKKPTTCDCCVTVRFGTTGLMPGLTEVC